MDIKVRFAPSPSGDIHIGNIRTAIFNWLFARHNEGSFLLRIEDTDKERSTKQAIDRLFECMRWLGLDFDENEFYQSKYETEHVEAAEDLINSNRAYYGRKAEKGEAPLFFRIPLDVEQCPNIRKSGPVNYKIHTEVPLTVDSTGIKFASISKKNKPVEFQGALAGFRDLKVYDSSKNIVFELDKNLTNILENNESFELDEAAEISYTRYEVFYNDLVKGELAKPLENIKDIVIIRSDGSPVFHLANVCDDIKQGITHIIRGDDHIENTYRHILLMFALGYNLPYYAHIPMIVNKQGKPYSKRDGDVFMGDFQEKGFLPEALFNYLSLLGWAPGDDKEKMNKTELIEKFTLTRVKNSAAQFDINKLKNLNGQYIAELPFEQFKRYAYNKALEQGWGAYVNQNKFNSVAELMQIRTKILSQVEEWKYFFFDESPAFDGDLNKEPALNECFYSYDRKKLRKILKNEVNLEGFKLLKEFLEDCRELNPEEIIALMRKVESRIGIEENKLNLPVRVAVTGKGGGADLYETLNLVGKESIIKRLEKILALKGTVE